MTATRLWIGVLGLFWIGVLAVGAVFVARGLAAEEPPHFYSEEQARSGIIVYAQQCASCHGADLAGTRAAPPLVGEPFWESWAERPVADLFAYISQKMPLGRGGSLQPEAYLDATALILWSNRLPAGEVPLRPATESLLVQARQVERAARIAPEVPSTGALLGPWIAAVQGHAQAATPPGEGAPDGSQDTAQLAPSTPDAEQADEETEQAQDDSGLGETDVVDDPAAPEDDPVPDVEPDAETSDTETITGEAGERVGPEEGVGDIRLSVFPQQARVAIAAVGRDDGVARDVTGGSRVVAGLAPGDYRIRAELNGRALEQVVTVRADAVLEVEMRFPAADVLPADEAPVAPLAAGDEIAGVVLDGSQLYRQNCLLCHGPQGGGIYGVALAGNPRLAEAAWPIRRVLLGGLGMPSFHRTLVPAEIAAVLSYVRTSFGNDYGSIDAQQVLDVREELQAELPTVLGAALVDAPLGQQRYTQLCSACHGLEGGGDVGPPLAGNPALQNDQLVITRILYGGGIMPSFAHHSDVEIAAIASYIRTAWSNDYAPISAAQVEVYRPDDTPEGATDARTGTDDANDAQ